MEDSAFKAFSATFEKYQQALARTPQAWQAVSGAAKSTVEHYEAMAGLMAAQNEHLIKLLRGQDLFGKSVGDTNRHMTMLERTVQSVSRHITDATRSILRWGTISSALAGLAGFGGLFGITRLAQNAAGDYRTATGLGVSPGQLRSLQAVLPFITDPGALLRSAATGKYGALSEEGKAQTMLGIGQQGDPFDIAMRTLEAAQKFAIQNRNNPLMMNMPQAGLFGQLGIGMEEFNRLRAMTPEQLRAQEEEARQFAGRAEQDQKTSEAWTKLMITLNEAGTLIEKSFITGLKDLAEPITHLSQAFSRAVEIFLHSDTFKHWIDLASQGLEWLAQNIDTPEFQKKITDFIRDVGELTDAIGRIVKGLVPIANWLSPKPTEGSTVKPGETLTPWGTFENPIHSFWERFKQLWDDQQEAMGHGRPGGTVPSSGAQAPLEPNKPYRPFGRSAGELPSHSSAAENVSFNNFAGMRALGGGWRGFSSPEKGISAIEASLLGKTYFGSGLNTLSGIISKWAPSSENPTAALIARATGIVGVGANDPLDPTNVETMRRLVTAMILNEHGGRLPKNLTQEIIDSTVRNFRTMEKPPPAVPSPPPAAATQGNLQHAALPHVRIFVDNRTGGSAVITGSQIGAMA